MMPGGMPMNGPPGVYTPTNGITFDIFRVFVHCNTASERSYYDIQMHEYSICNCFDRFRSCRRWHPPDGWPPFTNGRGYWFSLIFYYTQFHFLITHKYSTLDYGSVWYHLCFHSVGSAMPSTARYMQSATGRKWFINWLRLSSLNNVTEPPESHRIALLSS